EAGRRMPPRDARRHDARGRPAGAGARHARDHRLDQPYVGLFGTVWGIMHSFAGLGNRQTATLADVAPGISEALIATAVGRFAAVPAVIAYTRYADKVVRREIRCGGFMEEFSSILERPSRARRKGA